jgi:hypothetical protein
VNNEVTFNIKDPDTDESIELTIDINEIEIKRSPDHNKIINITDTIALQMRYPTIEYIEDLDPESEKSSDDLYKIMVECIESVVDGDQVYKLKDFTEKEVTEFLDSLTADVAMKIKKFFDTMPMMRYEKKYKNKNGVEKTFVAEGMETFFI